MGKAVSASVLGVFDWTRIFASEYQKNLIDTIHCIPYIVYKLYDVINHTAQKTGEIDLVSVITNS